MDDRQPSDLARIVQLDCHVAASHWGGGRGGMPLISASLVAALDMRQRCTDAVWRIGESPGQISLDGKSPEDLGVQRHILVDRIRAEQGCCRSHIACPKSLLQVSSLGYDQARGIFDIVAKIRRVAGIDRVLRERASSIPVIDPTNDFAVFIKCD
jgi:hypothetical protein